MANAKPIKIQKAPVRNVMKRSGANLVAKPALDTMINAVLDTSKSITKSALAFAKHAKRKKITAADVELAVKYPNAKGAQ